MSAIPATWRQKRIARNETSFRDINERLERALQRVVPLSEPVAFVCECGDRRCEESVRLSLDEYAAVREDSRRFAVVPGHVFPEVEHVVSANDRFEVVEKLGAAVEVTDAADGRVPGSAGRRARDPMPAAHST